MQTRGESGIVKPKIWLSLVFSLADTKPSSFAQASNNPKWVAAIADEFQALIANDTWELVPSTLGQNIVGCKWVYRIKCHSDGSIARYKARLVAQGFHQQAGINYHETFNPIVKPITISLLLSLAISIHWPIHPLDVKNAFLHGHLTEEVYMKQPLGFVHSAFPRHVCKLKKAIYSLKQAPQA